MVLNEEQSIIFENVKMGNNILITSPAGTGKSFLVKYIYKKLSKKFFIGITSTTGISAVLLGGSTIYHYLGIGLGLQDEQKLYKKILYNKEIKEIWEKLDILIIDEISMLSHLLFDKLNFVAKKIRRSDLPFGGIQIILSGDFLQLPVIGDDNRFVYHSKCWDSCKFKCYCMKKIVRQDEILFKNILLKIRVGDIDSDVCEFLNSRQIENIQDIRPTKLFCLKKYVDILNNFELSKLKDRSYQFFNYVSKIKKTCGRVDDAKFDIYKNLFLQNCTTPENLFLCKDAQVMLTYNIDTSMGLCNGSRGIVRGFSSKKYPIVEFLNSHRITVYPQNWDIVDKHKNVVGFFKQIPLKIAYALTIHSCQGLTLDCAEIDLMRAFEYGQIYTALSRVREMKNLFLKNINVKNIKCNPDALEFYKKIDKDENKILK